MRFLPRCSCVHTTIWMNYMDANKTHREKALCCFEKVLETPPHKTAAV